MKKTLTLLASLMITMVSFAQIDIAVKSIDQPTYLKDNVDGATTDFPLQFTLTNKGDVLNAGDTISYVFALINRETNTFLIAPAAGPLLVLNQEIATGADITTPLRSLQINTARGVNTDVSVLVQAFIFNRTTSPVDADSTDNLFLKEMIWEKQYGASVASTNFTNNIAAYPNPAVDVLTVELASAENNAVTIELMDLSGKVVTRQENVTMVNANQYKVDLTGIEKGLYIVKVTNGDEISTTKVTVSR